jgi:hypothetical protein
MTNETAAALLALGASDDEHDVDMCLRMCADLSFDTADVEQSVEAATNAGFTIGRTIHHADMGPFDIIDYNTSAFGFYHGARYPLRLQRQSDDYIDVYSTEQFSLTED